MFGQHSHIRPASTNRLFETVEAPDAGRFEFRVANSSILTPRESPLVTFSTGLKPDTVSERLPSLYNFLATQILGYESGIDSRLELPLFAELIGPPDYFALVIRDHHGGEYLLLLPPDFRTVPESPSLAIETVADTYEAPRSIIRELRRYDTQSDRL